MISSSIGILSTMSNRIERVLVTAIGTMNCTTIIQELKKEGNHYYVLGADINERQCVANSNEVDEYYQFPSVLCDREKYVSFVLSFCICHNIDYVYCVIDEEVEVLAKNRTKFDDAGIILCLANTEAIVTCHNKDLFAEWAEKEIPEYCIKRFISYDDVRDSDFPLFIKPVEGRASIGCRTIENREELLIFKDKWKDYIVEDFVKGEIVAVDIVRNRKTKDFEIAQRLELLRNSNGCGIAVQIIDNHLIREACEKIATKLDLNGVINAEFFIIGRTPKIIEVNPRLPAGIAYSCMAGLDVVMNSMRIAKGEACKFTPIKVGAYYAKRYETYETSI